MGLDYAQKNWDSEGIKLTVDKFVVVLVGAPRGVSTLTWVRNMPDQLRKTLYDEVNVGERTLITNQNSTYAVLLVHLIV